MCYLCVFSGKLYFTLRWLFIGFSPTTPFTLAFLLFDMLCLTQFIGCGLCPLTMCSCIHNILTVVQPSASESFSWPFFSTIHSDRFLYHFRHIMTHRTLLVIKFKARPSRWSFLYQNVYYRTIIFEHINYIPIPIKTP